MTGCNAPSLHRILSAVRVPVGVLSAVQTVRPCAHDLSFGSLLCSPPCSPVGHSRSACARANYKGFIPSSCPSDKGNRPSSRRQHQVDRRDAPRTPPAMTPLQPPKRPSRRLPRACPQVEGCLKPVIPEMSNFTSSCAQGRGASAEHSASIESREQAAKATNIFGDQLSRL